MLIACRPVRDAQQTVATADSMRVNEGRLYDDSLALAEAYVTTGKWRYIYPNDYARACYYYGYMLRQHGDQVAAMQAFIAGTHAPYIQRVVPLPWFSNYHILGRIYSNMGTMCHLAGEFELGYDMYELSARSFYKADDTTAFYYALNAMALQLAEQNMHDETLSLLGKIEMECADANVLTKTWETKAILYKNLAQYDSAIYAAGQLYSNGYSAASGYVTMAQSYEHLGQLDSALFYAQRVLAMPNASDKERYNMLYFFVYHDSSAGEEEKMKRYEERADIDNKNIDPIQEQLAQSTQLLQQDINHKPNKWVLSIIILGIGAMGAAIVIFVRTRRKLQQQQNSDRDRRIREIEQQCNRLAAAKNLKRALHMSDYNAMKRMVNVEFNQLIDKLESINTLSQREIQFCVLVLLNVPQKQIAQIMVYSDNSIKKTKTNIAKKMKITSPNLRNYLIDIILQ